MWKFLCGTGMIITILVGLYVIKTTSNSLQYSCHSRIYCYGLLLHTVQTVRLFNDSKTFVDMRMKSSEHDILNNFDSLMKRTDNSPTKAEIFDFVENNFDETDQLVNYHPVDWTPKPKILSKIKNPKLRSWAEALNKLWVKLGRQVDPDVLKYPDRYSLEPLPYAFIIPGGRFKEIYYWDSYWIINGLLLSGMSNTAKNMLDNLLWLVNKYGFVPNGSRVYYSQRSQPPLLSAMIVKYIETTNDISWLRKNILLVEKELNWWLQKRTVKIGNFKLARYYAPSIGPRPESYLEDITAAHNEQDIFSELKSAAESGWDFSRRWIPNNEPVDKKMNLEDLKISDVAPVDLNSFLCGGFYDAAKLNSWLGNEFEAKIWLRKADEWKEAIRQLMWNEQSGVWFDVIISTGKQNTNFYPTNIFPLWSLCIPDKKNTKIIGERVAQYLEKNGMLQYKGGVPTSLDKTGEQWDFPNAWPPLQSIVVQALKRSGSEKALKVANIITQNWVHSNYIGHDKYDAMYEKYDARNPGQYGGGGEYIVQSGFGWTNGVALEMLYDSGDWLNETNKDKNFID